MKKILFVAFLLAGSSAFANTTLLKCKVIDSNSVSMEVTLGDDQSIDFVTVSLVEKNQGFVFFSQMDKGTVANQLSNGFLNLLALTEKTSVDDGVIKNTGFLGLGKEADGTFGGFLAAQGNIYPLSCIQ